MNHFFNSFIRIAGIALGLVAVAALGENLITFLPAGTTVTLFTSIVVAITVFYELRASHSHHRLFVISIALIGLADFLFYLIHYYQNLLPEPAATGVVSTLTYALGFTFATLAFARASSWSFSRDCMKLLVPTLVIGFTYVYYFLPSLIDARSQSHSIVTWIAITLNTVANLAISIVALTTLIHSMNPMLNVMALGFSMLPLINFAISYEINLQGSVTFGFYEYCWAVGLFLIELPLLVELRKKSDFHQSAFESSRSIAVRYKVMMIATTAALLLMSPIIGGAGLSIRFVALALIASMVVSMLVSSFTVAAITHYSKTLGDYLAKGFTQSSERKLSLAGLPTEIEAVFSSAFAQSMQQQQERQIRLLRDRELHQKFAHDVRSPLQALNHLLAQAAFKNVDEKEACENAVRTLFKSSEEILGYLTPATPASFASPRATNVIDCFRRSQSIFTAAYPAHALSIHLNVKASYPYAWIDEVVLERLFLNLIQNAVESPKATVLEVSLESIPHSSTALRLTFTDNGEGASASDIRQLNDSIAFTRKKNGHGIGLSTQSNALKRFQASVHFSSIEDQSFTAIVDLKAATQRVVLIDDDRAIQLAWIALGKQKGTTVEIVEMSALSQLETRMKEIDRLCELYVDYYLGHEKGSTILDRLKTMGFQNLYLATSAHPSELKDQSWTVRDKTFPR